MRQKQAFLEKLYQLRSMQIRTYAGSAAFFLLLSFFPLISLLLVILHAGGLGPDELNAVLSGIVPKELTSILEWLLRSLDSASSGGIVSFSTVVLCVAASAGVRAIQEGLNTVCGIRESRSYLVRFGMSLLSMLAVLACLLLTLLLQVSAPRVLRQLPNGTAFYAALHSLLEHSRLTTLVLLTAIFSLLFLILPDRRISPLRVLPGALASAGGWILFSLLFSVYLDHFDGYSRLYGGLASAVILMFWLYICMYILFFGELLNRILFPDASKSPQSPKKVKQ